MNYEQVETLDGAEPSLDEMTREEAFALAVGELATAKKLEAQANARRIDAEGAVLRFITAKPEGSVTAEAGDYKVTVTFGVNRSLDAAALGAVRTELPLALFERAIEYRPAIALPGLRYLMANEPDAYAVLAQAITAKPSKPSLRLEPITKDL